MVLLAHILIFKTHVGPYGSVTSYIERAQLYTVIG